ncbi:unnamed protein product [Rhizopus microsporus]
MPPFNQYATVNLTQHEREKLTQDMIAKASNLVCAFPDIQTTIMGASLNKEQVQQFRSLVECWTSSGKWVKMDGPVKCDRKYKGEGQRDAVRYVWQSTCEPVKNNMDHSVNRDRWCKVLNGRHILVVGDLVQYQLHEIFLNTFRDGPTVCFGELNCRGNVIERSLGGGVRMAKKETFHIRAYIV